MLKEGDRNWIGVAESFRRHRLGLDVRCTLVKRIGKTRRNRMGSRLRNAGDRGGIAVRCVT